MIALLLMTGCLSSDLQLLELTLSGEVTAPEAGALTLDVHHAWQGEGALRHPLGLIERLSFDGPGPIDAVVAYPVEDGEGLVIYAWVDVDGDGALCSPEGDEAEYVGLVEVEDFPTYDVELSLELEPGCLGPEALFP